MNCDRIILMDDGRILLWTEASPVTGGTLLRVVRGGLLESKKSVALPGRSFQTPAMTENDREQIRRAGDYGVTAVMQPFVRSREDLAGNIIAESVEGLRRLLLP